MRIFNLLYEISNTKIIKLFDPYFVKRNKIKCKIVIGSKILPLVHKYRVHDDGKNLLKIKLIILDCNGLNLEKMFFECYNLKKFNDISEKKVEYKIELKEETLIQENDTLHNEEFEDDFFQYDNSKNNSLKSNSNGNMSFSKSFYDLNKLGVIYVNTIIFYFRNF